MPLKETFPSHFRCTSGSNFISTDIWQDLRWFIHLRTFHAVELSKKKKNTCAVKCFSWLVVKGKCLTLNNLQKRSIPLCKRCSLCEENAEDVNHLFLHRKVTCQSGIFLRPPWTQDGFTLYPLGIFVRSEKDGMSKVSSKI